MARTGLKALLPIVAAAMVFGIGTAAQAAQILLTLNGNGAHTGDTYTGTLDVPAYTNAAAGVFSIDSLHVDVIDELGNALVFDDSNSKFPDFTGISSGEMQVSNAGGVPDHLSPLPGSDFFGLAAPFVGIVIPVNVNPGVPDVGYQLLFNNTTLPGGGFATGGFTLNALIWDGQAAHTGPFYLTGTYRLSVVTPVAATPLPGTLPLFASALGAAGLVARRKNRRLSPGEN